MSDMACAICMTSPACARSEAQGTGNIPSVSALLRAGEKLVLPRGALDSPMTA
jgi:hypothetical protein